MHEMDPRAQALMPRISPTRAYISGALMDLGNAVRIGGSMQGLGQSFMEENQLARARALQMQQDIQQQQEQQQRVEQLRSQFAAMGMPQALQGPPAPGEQMPQSVVSPTQQMLSSYGQAFPQQAAESLLASSFNPTTATTDQQNFRTYEGLVDEGSPFADSFGRAAGFLPKEDSSGPIGGAQRLANGNIGYLTEDGVVDSGSPFYNEAEYRYQQEQRSEIADLYMGAANAQRIANRFETLAPQINTGVVGWAGETIKSALGTQDDVTELRQNYRMFKNTQVLALLPPGPASDRDIETFRSGFPDDTANPESIASWLRGRAKLMEAQARIKEHEMSFFANGGKMRDWPSEVRRFLDGLVGEVFDVPATRYDDVGDDETLISTGGN